MGEQEHEQRLKIMDAMEEDRAKRVGHALRSAGHGMSEEEDYQRRLAEQDAKLSDQASGGGQPSDERMEADVIKRLAEDHGIDDTEIQVQVTGGEVTLTGTVESAADRQRVEEIAKAVGVDYVMNNLRVRQEGTSGATG